MQFFSPTTALTRKNRWTAKQSTQVLGFIKGGVQQESCVGEQAPQKVQLTEGKNPSSSEVSTISIGKTTLELPKHHTAPSNICLSELAALKTIQCNVFILQCRGKPASWSKRLGHLLVVLSAAKSLSAAKGQKVAGSSPVRPTNYSFWRLNWSYSLNWPLRTCLLGLLSGARTS